eukprot:gene746-386_t
MVPRFITQIPPNFHRIYSVDEHLGHVSVPSEFKPRVRKMFSRYPSKSDSIDFVETQHITTVYNKVLFEHTLHNPLRTYRPGSPPSQPQRHQRHAQVETQLADVISASKNGCDFCRYRDNTAEDIFGRIEGQYTYTASNIAKYEGYHSLVLPYQHDPLEFPYAALHDMMKTASKWFSTAHQRDPAFRYPQMMWDCLPRASASQMHQHVQMSLTKDHYYGRSAQVVDAAHQYAQNYKSNYWNDVSLVHTQLGLAISYGDAILMASMTPIKEKELLVLAPDPLSPYFAALLHVALNGLKHKAAVRAFSAAIVLPVIGP